MKNKSKKFLGIVKKTMRVLLLIIITFIAGTTAWNKVLCFRENEALSKIGTTVNVNGNNIRTSVVGEGKKTIVLLSGMGTASPIIDFEPLADELSDEYKVVTIEYSGYGLSGDSRKERNNDAIVEEIRGTLKQLDIKPPYVLVPHSVSGIYCMKYMNSYPEEIEAMIGIESSIPEQCKYDGEFKISNPLFYLAKFMDFTGITRLSYLGGNPYLDDMDASGSYSEEQMKNVRALFSRKSITYAQLSEGRMYKENCESMYDMKCPDNIPVLFLLSKESCEKYKESLAKRGYDAEWDDLHKEVISNSDIQKIEYLDGQHYLQWSKYKEISKSIHDFIE